jgi:hypothetical protein
MPLSLALKYTAWAETVFLFCALTASQALAQSVRVRVVDARTGKPVGGKRIRIQFKWDRPQAHGDPRGPLESHQWLDLKAGPDGVAKFDLRPPLPKELDVFVAVGHWTQCSPFRFPVEDVLNSGVVAKNFCGSKRTEEQRYVATPGEVVVFTRHTTFRDRLREFPG